MCALLSRIDLAAGLRPVRVSAGEVVYPPGGRLGPRWQHDIELVLVHSGSARIEVDDEPPLLLRPDWLALLLPGHRESFEFDPREETHHSWVQLGVEGQVPERLVRAPRTLRASAAMIQLVREAVSSARAPLPTADELVAAVAAAALWRYAGEAEAGVDGPADAVELARRYLDLHAGDADVSLESVSGAAHVTPAHLVRRFRAELGCDADGLPVAAPRCGGRGPAHEHRPAGRRDRAPLGIQVGLPLLPPREAGDGDAADRGASTRVVANVAWVRIAAVPAAARKRNRATAPQLRRARP